MKLTISKRKKRNTLLLLLLPKRVKDVDMKYFVLVLAIPFLIYSNSALADKKMTRGITAERILYKGTILFASKHIDSNTHFFTVKSDETNTLGVWYCMVNFTYTECHTSGNLSSE